MNEKGPEKGKVIKLFPEGMDVIKSLIDGELSFPDDQKEKQEELERLKKLWAEAPTVQEKGQIEFFIRQLLDS
jgi:hypothetical protein